MIEKYLCQFYGKQNTTELNNAHYQMFCGKRKSTDPERLPPARDGFMFHLKRANYVTHIWKQALICHPKKLNPAYHGWDIELAPQIDVSVTVIS